MKMLRLDMYITRLQKCRLKQIAQHTGIKMSEHIRRAIDKYIEWWHGHDRQNPPGPR